MNRPLLALPLAAVVALAGCAGAAPGASEPTAPAATEATRPACPTAEPAPLPAGETRIVTIETSLGAIEITVDGALSPIAAGNFVALAACGYYDGVVFHRVVPGFVIQGGDGQYGRDPADPAVVGTGGPGYTITDEPVTATYGRGTVAMARTAAPNSQGSQFFIVLTEEARAPLESYNTYAIFGTVTKGLDTVDAVAAAADQEIPSEPIVMDRVTVATP
ncbi:MAG: hypothetical protein RL338_1373 [Chloroflexota bacterium]